VLSYAVGEPLLDSSLHGQHRQGQLKRQLLVHRTDVMCLSGVDPERSGAGLTATLVEEGYSYAWSRSEFGEASAIFWDRNRFALVGHRELGADLACDLHPWHFAEANPEAHLSQREKKDLRAEERKANVRGEAAGSARKEGVQFLRVVCMQPKVPTMASLAPSPLFTGRPPDGPLIVCADFTLLGGAESFVVAEELYSMNSAMFDILGTELLVPIAAPQQDGRPAPLQAAASKFNRLHCPDGMLYEGLLPLLALSGHSEQHLCMMNSEEAIQQFPAFRMPVVAAFQLPAPCAEATKETAATYHC